MSTNWKEHPYYDWLKDIRRDFHSHPELAFEETRTTAKIKDILHQLGLEPVELPGLETGAAAVFDTGRPGPCLAFRGDIDALPLSEADDRDYCSTFPGKMHACGHDAHTTIILGLARKLTEGGAEGLTGKVKFVFQPAEELVGGAIRMIQAGVLENPKVDRIVAGHVFPEYPAGQIGMPQPVSYAGADTLDLVITGSGGHGAFPEQVVDPVIAAANWINTIQTVISRNTAALDSAVVSIGAIHAGTAHNIIPQQVELKGTIRWMEKSVRARVVERLKEITEGFEKSLKVSCQLDLNQVVPAAENDGQVVRDVEAAAEKVVGRENIVYPRPVMGSEDFSLFTEAVPGAMFILGCGPESGPASGPIHSPSFDLDERVLPVGVEFFAQVARDFLKG